MTNPSAANAQQRLALIQRQARTGAALVRVLRRHFTADELGQMFDGLPDGDGPLATLVTAVGTAWSDETDADRRATEKEVEGA